MPGPDGRKFRIMHLSDLHRFDRDTTYTDGKVHLVERALDQISTIYLDFKNCNHEQKPDFLVISGDLVDGQGSDIIDADGKPIPYENTEYNKSELFIRELYKQIFDVYPDEDKDILGRDIQKLLLVPGNHDYCRRTCYESITRADPLTDDKEGDPHKFVYSFTPQYQGHIDENDPNSMLINGVEYTFLKERYRQKFDYFKKLYKNVTGKLYKFNWKLQVDVVPVHNIRNTYIEQVNFIGLNSAYAVHQFSKSAHLNSGAVRETLTKLSHNVHNPRNCMNILVVHHPINDGNRLGIPKDKLDQYIDNDNISGLLCSNDIALTLCGHMHNFDTYNARLLGMSDSLPVCTTGNSTGAKGDMRYTYYELNLSNRKILIHMRYRNPDTIWMSAASVKPQFLYDFKKVIVNTNIRQKYLEWMRLVYSRKRYSRTRPNEFREIEYLIDLEEKLPSEEKVIGQDCVSCQIPALSMTYVADSQRINRFHWENKSVILKNLDNILNKLNKVSVSDTHDGRRRDEHINRSKLDVNGYNVYSTKFKPVKKAIKEFCYAIYKISHKKPDCKRFSFDKPKQLILMNRFKISESAYVDSDLKNLIDSIDGLSDILKSLVDINLYKTYNDPELFSGSHEDIETYLRRFIILRQSYEDSYSELRGFLYDNELEDQKKTAEIIQGKLSDFTHKDIPECLGELIEELPHRAAEDGTGSIFFNDNRRSS